MNTVRTSSCCRPRWTHHIARLSAAMFALSAISAWGDESVVRPDAGAGRDDVRANRPIMTSDGTQSLARPSGGWRNESARSSGSDTQVTRKNEDLVSATSGPRWTELLGPLAMVLAIIAAVTYAVRRWLPRGMNPESRGLIRVLARQHLSAKQSICIVRLGRRVLVLGVCPEQVTCLTEIRDTDEASTFLAVAEKAKPESFSSLFQKVCRTPAATQVVEEESRLASAEESPVVEQAGRQVSGLLARVRELSAAHASVEPASLRS
jgi:flagellar biosynthetic protein FliO